MPTSEEIGKAGERIVVDWLQRNGYRVNWDTRGPGSTDIEAKNSKAYFLIQVKSAIYPNKPSFLSSDEERNIKSRASNLGAEAREARVQLNSSLQLLGEISWRKL